jgi:hypothetical protein
MNLASCFQSTIADCRQPVALDSCLTRRLFVQRTPRTRIAKATTNPHVLNQWYRSQRCSCAVQSPGRDSGLHLAIRLLMGTGPASENTTARTWIVRAVAANCQADLFRCPAGSSRRRFNSVELDIQNGITRPNHAASDERTNMCTSCGWRLRMGWANAATLNSLPHIRPRITTAKSCRITRTTLSRRIRCCPEGSSYRIQTGKSCSC